jgi:hypothetical protein
MSESDVGVRVPMSESESESDSDVVADVVLFRSGNVAPI